MADVLTAGLLTCWLAVVCGKQLESITDEFCSDKSLKFSGGRESAEFQVRRAYATLLPELPNEFARSIMIFISPQSQICPKSENL